MERKFKTVMGNDSTNINKTNNLNPLNIKETTTFNIENSGPGLKHAKKNCLKCNMILDVVRGCRDRMVVGFTTTYAISAYHH